MPVVQLCGGEAADKRAIASGVSEMLGLNLYVCCGYHIPTTPNELETMRRLWEREAILSESVLLLECDEAEVSHQKAIRWLIEHTRGALIVSSKERVRAHQRTVITFDVVTPSAAEQRALWHHALGPLAGALNGQVEQLVSQFNLSGSAIQAVCTSGLADFGAALSQAVESMAGEGLGEADDATWIPFLSRKGQAGLTGGIYSELERVLWETCRVQARPRLDDLAQRIIPSADWEGLVLPDLQRQVLRDMIRHVRQRQKVYESWGFAKKSGRGLGISALFAGASGTGKTMAAEVLADELRLDLYRIDLSSVVSKYIGETEKNLRRIFDAAEAGGVILLFDEADALWQAL